MSRTRPIRPSRGRSGGGAAKAGGLVLAIVGIGLVVWSLGLFEPRSPEADVVPEGHVAVPVASGPIPAYTAIQLDHLLDPTDGRLTVIHLPEGSLLPETVGDAKELLGRVLARDKAPGAVFREDDLLPHGTRPGLVAGIPAGKRALRIDASKVNGIIGLRRGDRFDLVATLRARGGGAAPAGGGARLAPRATVHEVVVDGAVVEPLSQRQLPAARGGGQVVQEMVVAVSPAEVPLLTEALEVASRIDCVPRSGHPEERALKSVVAEPLPFRRRFGGENLVDTIQGDQRTLRSVPSAELPSVSTGPRSGG